VAVTEHLPILMYHRIADAGAEATARWRVTPDEFERQVSYLSAAGFGTVSLEEWHQAANRGRSLPERAVVLTFDDAYEDFATHAWPVLESYGLGALVFLVSANVGSSADWDRAYGNPAPLLDWDTARDLGNRGVEFGSHCISHPRLTQLATDEIAHELSGSRRVIERELERPIDAIAYPYGSYDAVVEDLARASGYVFGLTCVPGPARFGDRPLALPRQEISGSTTFAEFVSALRG
jgi:peptidoglycan/xylan/chitin deacetylase (PgdA/CDA1 family)